MSKMLGRAQNLMGGGRNDFEIVAANSYEGRVEFVARRTQTPSDADNGPIESERRG